MTLVRHLALVLLVLSVLLAGCGDNQQVPPSGERTYFEALDLSTPSAAAETFLDAFARDDFMTVWLALHPNAQKLIEINLDLLQYRVIIDSQTVAREVMMERSRLFPPESIGTWHLFDALMFAADEHDAFIIDLSGPVRVTDQMVDGDEAELSAEASGIEGTVTLQMEKWFEGSWRVRIVTIGSDGERPVVWPDPNAGR